MARNNKVSPISYRYDHYQNVAHNKYKVNGETRMKKWTRMMASIVAFPLGYIMLPISCCVISPAVKYAHPNMVADVENEKLRANASLGLHNFAANISGMVMGCCTILTCGCCCGCCCTHSPDDIYDK